MRLKSKIGFSVFGVIVLVTLVNIAAVSWFFLPAFKEQDKKAAAANGARAYEYLHAETESLRSATRDWAQWDDTYDFASDFNQTYQANNLKPNDFKTLKVDAFAVVGDTGTVRFFDGENPGLGKTFQVGHPLPKGMFAPVPLDGTNPVSREGFVDTAQGPMLVSVAPILKSVHTGPQRGYLVLARLLGPQAAHIRNKAGLDFALTPYGQARGIAPAGSPSQPRVVETKDSLTANYVLHDVTGQPSYVLQVRTAPEFTDIGWIAVKGAMIRFAWLTAVFLAIIGWLMGRLVARPLAQMVGRMEHIALTGDLDRKLDIDRSDEIGWVADVFNRMMDQLKVARSRQIEQSYATGMADLAAGILNNVRNAVSPIVEANSAARQTVDKLDTATLSEAGRELTFTTIDQERRQKLGTYVVAFSEGTKIRLSDLAVQLDRIDRSAQHIRHILQDHESISRWPRQSEPIDCQRLVEETARGISGIGETPIDVEVSTGGPQLPSVLGHSFILRQVIGNLLANSVDAIRHAQRKRGRIHIFTRKAEHNGRPVVEIVVGDNGAGFTETQAEHLFDRGYSTRSDRPGGFGLYWCRDALGGMNASIVAQSPGPGLGATFRIFLPIAPQESGETDKPAALEGVA